MKKYLLLLCGVFGLINSYSANSGIRGMEVELLAAPLFSSDENVRYYHEASLKSFDRELLERLDELRKEWNTGSISREEFDKKFNEDSLKIHCAQFIKEHGAVFFKERVTSDVCLLVGEAYEYVLEEYKRAKGYNYSDEEFIEDLNKVVKEKVYNELFVISVLLGMIGWKEYLEKVS